jgi:hypothetical protein
VIGGSPCASIVSGGGGKGRKLQFQVSSLNLPTKLSIYYHTHFFYQPNCEPFILVVSLCFSSFGFLLGPPEKKSIF